MSDYKGSGIVFLREQVRRREPALEQALLDRLDAAERAIYLETMSMSWVDMVPTARVLETGIPLLLPEAPDPARAFGRIQAHEQLSGIYRILLRVASVPMVIQQSARLWSTYHNRGQARVERQGDEPSGRLVVAGYPELPLVVRRTTSGFIEGTLERTAVRNIRVVELFADPQAWIWDVNWG